MSINQDTLLKLADAALYECQQRFIVVYREDEPRKWRYFITTPDADLRRHTGRVLFGPYRNKEACERKVERLRSRGWRWDREK